MTAEPTTFPINPPRAENVSTSWSSLYKLGGISSLLLVAIVIVQLIVFSIVPPPLDGTAMDWFILFQKSPIIGLIHFELLMILYVILCIPITLSLYTLLYRVNPSWTTVYLILSLLGVMCFIAARPAFEMLHLSNGYAAAETEMQKAAFLAAGEAKVATFHGTAFYINYILGSLTGLMISMVMLKTTLFSKATAYVRIASSICDFGLFVPTIGRFIAIFSLLFLVIWNIMIARRFFQLANAS